MTGISNHITLGIIGGRSLGGVLRGGGGGAGGRLLSFSKGYLQDIINIITHSSHFHNPTLICPSVLLALNKYNLAIISLQKCSFSFLVLPSVEVLSVIRGQKCFFSKIEIYAPFFIKYLNNLQNR
jgi:hypothetical protein